MKDRGCREAHAISLEMVKELIEKYQVTIDTA
jgi:hypothetical protein